jgi:arabinogalactan oligomer/maltooligosaccharide transport system substrate-binding protein
MRNMRGTVTIVGAGLLLAACGSAGAGSDTSASAREAAAPSADAAILIWSDPAHAPALQASAVAHKQATGVEVVVQTVGTDLTKIRDDITTLAPQGQGPDLFVGQSDWVGQFVDFSLLAAVDLTAQASRFRPVAVDGVTYDGRTYAVPFATENLALFRNTQLAPQAPDSIDVMARDGLERKDKDDSIVPIALPVGPQGDAYHWYPFYSAAGGTIFGLDAQGGYTADELEVGKPGSIEAAKALATLTEDGALDRDLSLDEALTAFTAGRAPFFISGPWSVEPVRASGVPFVVEAVPGFDAILASRAQAMVTSLGLFQSAFARNPAAAQQYLATTAMTTEVISALAAPGGLAPAWSESYTAAATDPVIKGFGDFADASEPTPNLAAMDLVWAPLSQAQVDVMSGENPTRTMKAAGQEIQSAIDAG